MHEPRPEPTRPTLPAGTNIPIRDLFFDEKASELVVVHDLIRGQEIVHEFAAIRRDGDTNRHFDLALRAGLDTQGSNSPTTTDNHSIDVADIETPCVIRASNSVRTFRVSVFGHGHQSSHLTAAELVGAMHAHSLEGFGSFDAADGATLPGFYKGKKGESCFGRSSEAEYFLMAGFSRTEGLKVVAAMRMLSKTLCSKLEKFEAALPEGAGNRVWNIRKSQNRELVIVRGNPDRHCNLDVCGCADVDRGDRVHSIEISIDPKMVQSSTTLGVAVVMVHEIAHQFAVNHYGWMNTYDYEGALWASHRDGAVRRSDIAQYIKKANDEIGSC